jgi:hypothetical protein
VVLVFFLDWVPFSSPAIQTIPISLGTVIKTELPSFFGSRRKNPVESVSYCLRLDGIFLFSLSYNGTPESKQVYWDSIKIASFLRRSIFKFDFLPEAGTRQAWLHHSPTRIEDITTSEFSRRTESNETHPLSLSELADYLAVICRNDFTLCSILRYSENPVRKEHFACLHLKSQMGRRKNELEREFQDQLAYEDSNRSWRGAATGIRYLT